MWWFRRPSHSPLPTAPSPSPELWDACPRLFSQCLHQGKRCGLCGFERSGKDPLLGRQIGGYVLMERARESLCGTVYLAQSSGRSELSAFHILRPANLEYFDDPAALRERVAAWAGIMHPSVASVEAFGHSEHGFYWATRWIEGFSLQQLLRDFAGGLPDDLWLDILQQLLRVLDHLHTSHLIVGQLRPEHLLLSPRGRRLQLQLIDIGCGPLLWTRKLQTLPSPHKLLAIGAYLPPEQMTPLPTPIEAYSDLYSTGILLFQMITGRLPFRSHHWEELYKKQRYAPLPPLRDLAPPVSYIEPLEALFLRALAKEPHQRFSTADAFLREIAALPFEPPLRHLALGWDHAFWNAQKDLDNTQKLEALNAARAAFQRLPETRVPAYERSPSLFSSQWLRASQLLSSPTTAHPSHPSLQPEHALSTLKRTQRSTRFAWTLLGFLLFFALWWAWLFLYSFT